MAPVIAAYTWSRTETSGWGRGGTSPFSGVTTARSGDHGLSGGGIGPNGPGAELRGRDTIWQAADCNDRGSATLELAIAAPVLLLLITLVIVAGRVAQAHQVVEAAAGEAARAATAAGGVASARAQADAAVAAALDSAGLACQSTSTQVDTSQWALPVGRPARVTATVTCQVRLSDLAMPGLPGSRLVTGSAGSALDTYRFRG